jgi:predicted NBD/HSP70 family sugar kinase
LWLAYCGTAHRSIAIGVAAGAARTLSGETTNAEASAALAAIVALLVMILDIPVFLSVGGPAAPMQWFPTIVTTHRLDGAKDRNVRPAFIQSSSDCQRFAM